MYKIIKEKLTEEEIKREVDKNYCNIELSKGSKEHIKNAPIPELLRDIAKIADFNCLSFQDTYLYEYVKAVRDDIPWEDIVIIYEYETKESCDYGAPNVSVFI